jgi:hypothetical protein
VSAHGRLCLYQRRTYFDHLFPQGISRRNVRRNRPSRRWCLITQIIKEYTSDPVRGYLSFNFTAMLIPEFSSGLVYHPHHRPLTSPAAALLDLSASLHSKIPSNVPTPSAILRSLGSTSSPVGLTLHSMANALTIPPIHVEHVAEAICAALDPAREVRGIVGVRRMRELIGWSEKGSSSTAHV